MQFSSRQTYRHDVDDVVDAYADPSMYVGLPELPKIGRPEVLDERRTGDLVHLDIRYAYTGDLPGAALAVIDPAKLTWIQRTTVDLSGRTTTLSLLPDHYPDRLRCAGTFHFSGRSEVGSQRAVQGDLRVKVMVVAGQVERALVSGLEEFLDAEAAAVDAWIDALV
ncbi:MAG: DUF2505 domain-containing protein [Acidimicrobiales bacterium]|jgi:hypothetical protein|nr:DUF2505 domain-containing protein [Acidimicrobiales bacterium]